MARTPEKHTIPKFELNYDGLEGIDMRSYEYNEMKKHKSKKHKKGGFHIPLPRDLSKQEEIGFKARLDSARASMTRVIKDYSEKNKIKRVAVAYQSETCTLIIPTLETSFYLDDADHIEHEIRISTKRRRPSPITIPKENK